MVYEAFEEDGGLKEQMFSQHKADINAAIIKVIAGVGITFLTAVIGFTVYITTISNTVTQLEQFANRGDRFTNEDGRILEIQIEANKQALQDVARASDLQELKEAFIRLDERLRNKGI